MKLTNCWLATLSSRLFEA